MRISKLRVEPKPTISQRTLAYSYWEKELGKKMCYVCGRVEKNGFKKTGKNGVSHLELHHIKPRSFGGSNNPKNLIPLCHKCHKKTHDEIYKFIDNVIFRMTEQGYVRKNGQLDSEVVGQVANYSHYFFAKILDKVKEEKNNTHIVEFSEFLMEPDTLL